MKLTLNKEIILGSVGIIAITTLMSRIIGFTRWIAQGAWVGSGEVAGTYALANQVPNIIVEIVIGGALTGIMIPILAGAITTKRIQQVNEITSALLTWVSLILSILCALLIISAPTLATLIPTPNDTDPLHQQQLITQFLQIFAWQLPFYGIALVLGGTLQAHEKFLWPALTPIFSSLVTIITFASYQNLVANGQPTKAITVLGWGTTGGVIALSLPLLIPIYQSGIRLKPTLKIAPSVRRQAIEIGGAGIIALIAQQLSVTGGLILMRIFGSAGTVAVFQYGQAIYLLPYAVLIFPVVTAFYPRLAAIIAKPSQPAEYPQAVAQTLSTVMRAASMGTGILLAGTPFALAVFNYLTPVDGMGLMLFAMAFSLTGYGVLYLAQRVLYALDRAWTAAGLTAFAWTCVLGFQGLFIWFFTSETVTALIYLSTGTGWLLDGNGTLLGMGLGMTVGLAVAKIFILRVLQKVLPEISLRQVLQETLGQRILWILAGILGALVCWFAGTYF